ncbi:MAG: DNA-directed RNA polymerase subunit omega [Clostridiales bacterium]|nr:DNA-directed RNA polymerase subunit omega [Clostridiales bacterium]
MIFLSLDELTDKVDNRYSLVVQVAKRARQLVAGQQPLVETESNKPVSVAIHEVEMGKINSTKAEESAK